MERPISRGPQPPSKGGPRINEQIKVEKVRLVDENGEMIGVVDHQSALERAVQAGLDLVEVSPNAEPPVCKILDYGKYKYQEQKKQAEARKKQKIITVKEVKVRPNIEEHDYQVKMRNTLKFLAAGDKVKVTLRFRGREMAHQDIGLKILKRIRTELEEIARVEHEPSLEGRQVIMVLAPK